MFLAVFPVLQQIISQYISTPQKNLGCRQFRGRNSKATPAPALLSMLSQQNEIIVTILYHKQGQFVNIITFLPSAIRDPSSI
jgi:hypothetical protein